MVLSIKLIEALKPKEKAYKVGDQHGLYLYVSTTGTKSWRRNGKVNGKQVTLTYGKYPAVSLATARLLNQSITEGTGDREQQKDLPTFNDVFLEWLKVKLPSLKNPKSKINTRKSIELYALPSIGHLPVNQIKRTQLAPIVKLISDKGNPETAKKIASRLCMIFDFAVDCGYLESHPANGLSRLVVAKKTVSMPCIPVSETGKLLALIQAYPDKTTRLGLLLAAHCFVRTIELRTMRFSDVEWDKSLWVIPAEHMKMGKRHVVPLSRQVLELLPKSSQNTLVLASEVKPKASISENTLLFALYRLGYRGLMTTHGFRALASTVLNESGLFSPDVIERQLAHKESDKIRLAYNRAEYLEQRIAMMQWYSDWLDVQFENYKKSNL
jgi:integrase